MKRILCILLVASGIAYGEGDLQDAMKAYQAGDFAGAKAQLEVLAAKEPSNATVRNYLKMARDKAAAQEAAERYLNSVRIPVLALKDSSAREAFDYTLQVINRNAPAGKVTNMVWAVPADYAQRVTLSLQDIPAGVALTYVAEAAGLSIAFEEHAVKVTKP